MRKDTENSLIFTTSTQSIVTSNNFRFSPTLPPCLNNNMCYVQKVDYLTYLSTFDRVFEIPREKKNQDYKKSVCYLCSAVCSCLVQVLGSIGGLFFRLS